GVRHALHLLAAEPDDDRGLRYHQRRARPGQPGPNPGANAVRRGAGPRADSRRGLSWTAMFDQLSDCLQGVLSDVRSRGKLSEDDLNKALREVRLALLEADVNFKVVKAFTPALKEG